MIQRLTINPSMRTTELLYKTIEVMKTVGTLLPSVQTHLSYQHQLQLYVYVKERIDPTMCQASLGVMEVLKREY